MGNLVTSNLDKKASAKVVHPLNGKSACTTTVFPYNTPIIRPRLDKNCMH